MVKAIALHQTALHHQLSLAKPTGLYMKIFNIHEAKTQLSKLIESALAGEEIIIAKAGKPLVRLIPYLVLSI